MSIQVALSKGLDNGRGIDVGKLVGIQQKKLALGVDMIDGQKRTASRSGRRPGR